mmetsp:Transcript_20702/g.46328  ORF Transcript_20702/g.46328 Transcript_20702/m.46328 type:complete len:207 (+) Transcript_20702:1149-1769(+)
MTPLVQARHQPRLVLGDGRDHRTHRLLAIGVDNNKLVTKIAENAAEEAKSVGHDEAGTRHTARIVDRDRLGQRDASEHDDPELSGKLGGERSLVHGHGDVLVELCEPRRSHLCATPPSVSLCQKELRREVSHLDRRGVVERDRLDTTQHHVFCDLNTQAFQANNQHSGARHAAHRLVTQHVELPAVERLVDRDRVCWGGGVHVHGI